MTIHFPEHYSDYTVKWASLDWEREQAWALRRQVFCIEQGLFKEHDTDEIDANAQCLVAIANHGGWPDKVVGTVRIHVHQDKVWWGSRLAVAKGFRHASGLGAALIKLAVGSAKALGCEQFYAQVQAQNEALFQKLNWESHYRLQVKGREHVMMQADLSRFKSCHNPYSGYVMKDRQLPQIPDSVCPSLLNTWTAQQATGVIAHAH